MKITQRDIEVFKLLNRYRYLRRTFIHALLATQLDQGRLRHRIYALSSAKYLREPEQQKQSGNYRYTPRVYELGLKGRAALQEQGIALIEWNTKPREFWHQLMISDVLASVEVACMQRGLRFRTRWDILGTKSFHLSCTDGQVRPDELCAIEDTPLTFECDRGTETNVSPLDRNSSWSKEIHQYADVFKNRTYQTEWGVQSLIVLNMFASPIKAENVRNYIADKLGKKSRSMAFRGMRSLGSHDIAPKPILSILDDQWHRAGHDPLTILSALERR
jgi:hypothetical protein